MVMHRAAVVVVVARSLPTRGGLLGTDGTHHGTDVEGVREGMGWDGEGFSDTIFPGEEAPET